MENQNSVAFISIINKISSIKDADKIELVQCENWTSVTRKDVHKEGDLVLCITTDAVIPLELSTKWGVINYLRKETRVRTVKLKGVYSECILIPLKELTNELLIPSDIKNGDDCMSYLKIFKYESLSKLVESVKLKKAYFKFKEIYKIKMWKSYFNYLINLIRLKFKKYYNNNLNFNVYYKFPNQKNTPDMFNETDVVSITRKIHGSNFRAGIVKKNSLTIKDRINILITRDELIKYEFVYGSHKMEKGSDSQGFYSTDIWKEIVDKYNLKFELLNLVRGFTIKELGSGFILYGEIYGGGVQGEHYNYGLNYRDLATFDMSLDGKYISDEEFFYLNDFIGTKSVLQLYYGKWSKEEQDKHINAFINDTKVPHEGIVVKCITGDRRKVSKVINPNYLIFGEKNNIEDLESH